MEAFDTFDRWESFGREGVLEDSTGTAINKTRLQNKKFNPNFRLPLQSIGRDSPNPNFSFFPTTESTWLETYQTNTLLDHCFPTSEDPLTLNKLLADLLLADKIFTDPLWQFTKPRPLGLWIKSLAILNLTKTRL